MPDGLYDSQRAVLEGLGRLIAKRRDGEEELAAAFAQARDAAIAKGEKARKALAVTQERERADLDAAFHKEQEILVSRQAAEEKAAGLELAEHRDHLETEEQEARAVVEEELRDALWMAESVAEGGQKRAQHELDRMRRQLAEAEERIGTVWQEAEPLLARFGLEREDLVSARKPALPASDGPPDPQVPLDRADRVLGEMSQLRALTWTHWTVATGFGVVAGAAITAPAAFVDLPPVALIGWVVAGLFAAFLVGWLTRTVAHAVARRRLLALGRKVYSLLAYARSLAKQLVGETEPWAAAQQIAFRTRHDIERRKAESLHQPRLDALSHRGSAARETVEQEAELRSQARREQDRMALDALRRRYDANRARCVARQEKDRRDAEDAHAEGLRYLELTHTQKLRQLRDHWQTEGTRLLGVVDDLQRVALEWRQGSAACGVAGKDATPQAAAGIAGLTLGTAAIDILRFAGNLPTEMLAPLPAATLHVPAFLPFPRLGGLLLQASAAGRAVSVQTLQGLMLRLLTALPPGKVRFTIFDPVGLGDNFAAFMHLADYNEALVTSRIWTEPAHIEKQLADLTAHMENVIQRYLRSQFSSIEEYNAKAGEVAEPYRVLVVANFPVNFTPQAARRLVSIVQSGSSCGVYALIGMDTRQALPRDFQIDDLARLCLNLHWREDRFQWGDPEMDRYPLTLEAPPAAERVVEAVQRVGAESRDAGRVRVPFSFIAPAAGEVWKGDSRRGVAVPLGRAGAVARMTLQLGKGTSQHVLVAGKTGSGKSTLWHALIANLALRYRPDEVELYLIDFKKGVEFKAYAQHGLPHARVIAIESEREFGLSVLQRLDAELRERGDRFRAAGVNDVASFRDSLPGEPCPRILLIVDEFQEFFVEDDRLSQEAALLLDRLVRQGRAFGLHVLLGSQTLGGAYSLARSTIDQMAVRIALQCSEADAQLILNKDNNAARLLSRPGEAIYNDSNGALEGNEIFQVVWLPEEEREQLLARVRQLAAAEAPATTFRPPLVFEGNTPAELEDNPLLARLLAAEGEGDKETRRQGDKETEELDTGAGNSFSLSPCPHVSLSAFAWLGEAIAIKDPTAAVFRLQTGDNLLVVGQNDEAALALLTASLIGLAVQQPSAQFHILDGTAAHQPHAGYLKAVAEGWSESVTLVDRAGLAVALAGLTGEMNQRNNGNGTDHAKQFVLINGLQHYREFRRGEDDLGFGRRGAERTVSPLEHLQALLRDGPVVGIHLLIWCDSLVNVMRSLDRAGLRECGQRVLFQMSAADSSHLLDSPLASRLGRNRALYYTDETGQPEKFRPYGLPSLAWLTEVKRRCQPALATSEPVE